MYLDILKICVTITKLNHYLTFIKISGNQPSFYTNYNITFFQVIVTEERSIFKRIFIDFPCKWYTIDPTMVITFC